MITHLKAALAAVAVGAVALASMPSVAHADTAAITVQWTQNASMVQTYFRDVMVDRQSVDIDHQRVRITGTFLGIAPDTGAVSPLAGLLLHITDAYVDTAVVTTAADGTFSALDTIIQAGPLQVVYPSDDGHPDYSSSTSAAFPITVIRSSTRIVEHVSATRIPYAATVSASGTLQWKSRSGWRPMADKTVTADGCGIAGSATTDAHGNLRFPSAVTPEGTTCTVLMGWPSDDPYKEDAYASATVTVG